MSIVAKPLKIRVTDSDTNEPLQFAAVLLQDSIGNSTGGYTDSNGMLQKEVQDGKWIISVNLVGYKPSRLYIPVGDLKTEVAVSLHPNDPIAEVVVTARESRSASSASVIDSTAMQHLQPSSFTDLLELLPGNVSQDPSMGSPNIISLRTANNVTPSDDYLTSAIGTSFIVDGVPINTNSNMQTTADSNHAGHATVGKGVDMRAIGTDDIEKVEIVRGIASVEYGELTSGLVNIKRKSGASRLEARFKADSKSQLFYVGKGFAMPGKNWILNTGIGYLDAKIDPRNSRENYKRINASIRSNKRFDNTVLNINWNSSLNYGATFERDNNDPDLTVNNTIDRFSTTNHSWSWNNALSFKPVSQSFFYDASLTTGISYNRERLHQVRHVAPFRLTPMTVSMVQGSNYVGFLPMLYLATLDVEGDPLNAYVKGATTFRFTHDEFTSNLKAGIEWNMSKNYGRGNVYDITRPITYASDIRPRSFNDIPAMHQLSAYVESSNTWRFATHTVETTLGLRETQLLHLDNKYALSAKPYIDPRATLTWTLPALYLSGKPMIFELNSGIGLQTKMPIASFLYPNLRYYDFEQLNYYHNVPAYRTMNVMTYVEDVTNYDLKAARNLKWEVRADLSFMDNRLSVTYFRENMNDGFRHSSSIKTFYYRKYDASAFDPYAVDRAPVIEELPYTDVTYLTSTSRVTNGSQTRKEGVEYTFQSRRISGLHTRVTVSGAYLQTINNNSQPQWYRPSIIIDGRELQYMGLYDDIDGSVYRSFNTNLMFDTDLPKLGLRFSLAMQTMWFTSHETMFKDGIPTHYMDINGNLYEYDVNNLPDPALKELVRTYSSTTFEKTTVPPESMINLKATKSFWKSRINVALYVNRLFSIQPDYHRYGQTVRRYSSPYFGMELNLKL